MQIRVCTRRYVAHTIYDGQFIEMAGLLSSPVFSQTFLGLPRRISAGIYSRVRVYYVYTHIHMHVECNFLHSVARSNVSLRNRKGMEVTRCCLPVNL